ncbi:Hypothetical protein MVR_LOCUS390 [uncultured virus]|nr:Hypothetical protein MVR_LOCUS390 [uncultured virus]
MSQADRTADFNATIESFKQFKEDQRDYQKTFKANLETINEINSELRSELRNDLIKIQKQNAKIIAQNKHIIINLNKISAETFALAALLDDDDEDDLDVADVDVTDSDGDDEFTSADSKVASDIIIKTTSKIAKTTTKQ